MRKRVRHWGSGWGALAHHDDVPGYRAKGALARLALEFTMIGRALRTRGMWGAVLVCIALGLGAQILCWQLDLRTWRRDGLLCLPVLLVAPWAAAGRRRHLAHMFCDEERVAPHGGEDGAGGTHA